MNKYPNNRKQAKILGEKFYYTGKLCINGHDSKRKTVNGCCYVCALENTNKWLKERPEYCKSRVKKWKELNHEKHKIQHANRCKKYRETKKQAVYETGKKYRQSNKAKILSLTRKRQANKLNATPKWLTKQHFIEIECKYSVAEMLTINGYEPYQVDHIIPSVIPCEIRAVSILVALSTYANSKSLDLAASILALSNSI